MKRVIHSLLLIVGFWVWAIGVLFLGLATWIAAVGDQVIPGLLYGNCWSYALPRYWGRGGYLIVRRADDVRFLKYFHIPHVMWCAQLPPGMAVEQFVPLVRSKTQWLPWRTIWYPGRIRLRERRVKGADPPETDRPGL